MFQLLIAFVSRIYAFFQRSMPTNILIRATHTRRGLKWGVPAMLLAVVYIVIAAALAQWVAGGAPGWINLLVLLCLWNALKFFVNGPISALRLARVRSRERRYREATAPAGAAVAGEPNSVHRV
jgi:hypothetical protein